MQITVRGRVQGVGFRALAAREARRLGVRGWVRNLPAGEVEVLAGGEPVAIEELVRWVRHGPPGARVTGVDVNESVPETALESAAGFTIR